MRTTAVATIPHRIAVSDDDGYMLIGEVCERFRCSRMWVTRRLADPILPFPKPIKFGGPTSARRWRRADVLAWEVARAKNTKAH
jgi:predicted DNA-binding transcriptional regulator AlpA